MAGLPNRTPVSLCGRGGGWPKVEFEMKTFCVITAITVMLTMPLELAAQNPWLSRHHRSQEPDEPEPVNCPVCVCDVLNGTSHSPAGVAGEGVTPKVSESPAP